MTATPAEPRLAALTGPVVVDASVTVEYLVGLSFTTQAEAIFRSVVDRDTDLWGPDLLYAESVSALRKLLRLRVITREAAEAAVGHLMRLPLTIVGTGGLMARVWALRDAITPYDACYAALAEALEAPFVTADRRLARTLAREGVRVVFLGDLA